jgi:hypothetical protein
LIPPAFAEITNFSRFWARLTTEQQRINAKERNDNIGRLEVLLIEIPSETAA